MQKRYWSIVPSFLLFIIASFLVILIKLIIFNYILKIPYDVSKEIFYLSGTLEFSLYWIIIFLLIRIKRISFSQYLNLKPVSFKTAIIWLGITLFFLAILSTICWVVTGKLVVKINRFFPDFSWSLVIMGFISSVIIAPATEEMLMRGFLFKSIEHSKLGKIGAVIITAFLFMLLHVERSLWAPYLWISILPLGLLCGIARAQTQSTLVAMGIHAVYNFYLFMYDLIEALNKN